MKKLYYIVVSLAQLFGRFVKRVLYVFRQQPINKLRDLKILDLPLALSVKSLHPQLGSFAVDVNQNLRAGDTQDHSINQKYLIGVFVGIVTPVVLNQEEEQNRV